MTIGTADKLPGSGPLPHERGITNMNTDHKWQLGRGGSSALMRDVKPFNTEQWKQVQQAFKIDLEKYRNPDGAPLTTGQLLERYAAEVAEKSTSQKQFFDDLWGGVTGILKRAGWQEQPASQDNPLDMADTLSPPSK